MPETMDDTTTTVESPQERLSNFFKAPEVAPAEEQEQATETEETTAEQAEPEEVEEAPTAEDIEIDGETIKVPAELAPKIKELRDGYLRRNDYNVKAQNLASITKQLSTIVEVARANEDFEKAIAPKKGELESIKHQLSQFKGVDWGSLEVSQHLALRAQMEQLKERSTELQAELQEQRTQLQQMHATRKSEVLKAGNTYLAQSIKGWSEKSQADVISRGRDLGFTDDELSHMLDARIVRALYESAQFQKAQSDKSSVLTSVQKAPPFVKPGAVNNTQATQQDKALRERLKRSGKVDDAAALLKKFF